jgi:hypothetical protein
MTYRIDRNQFIENGPTIAADAAIARVRRAALYAAIDKRGRDDLETNDRGAIFPKAA